MSEIAPTATERKLMKTSLLALQRLEEDLRRQVALANAALDQDRARHQEILEGIFRAHDQELPEGARIQFDDETNLLRFVVEGGDA